MSYMHAIRTPGSASIPGAPTKDWTDAEGEVANIQSIRFWPCLAAYGMKNGVVIDRMQRFAIPSYGSSNALSNLGTMVNGKSGYKVNGTAQILSMTPFNTVGSFTVGCVCADQLAFGSVGATNAETDSPAPWWIYSNASGAGTISAAFGSLKVAESVSATWAKKLSATKLTAVVLIYDRPTGRISLRYDGVEVWAYATDAVKTVSLMQELNLGGLRVAGSPAQVANRPMFSNAFVAFESALAGTQLNSLELMLMEAAAMAA